MEKFEKLTLEDLQKFIDNEIPESSDLEYKASEAINKLPLDQKEYKEFCKDLTAMANANGGRVIYGINEKEDTETKQNIPAGFDDGIDSTRPKLTLDALNQKIRDNTQPSLQFNSYSIQHPTNRTNRNLIYIFDIPRSERAIQVTYQNDCRYYQRHQTSNLVMQHWQIEDVNNRAKGPDLDLVIKSRGKNFNDFQNMYLDFTAINRNPIIADYLVWHFKLETELALRFSQIEYMCQTPKSGSTIFSISGQSSHKAKFVQSKETGIFASSSGEHIISGISLKLEEKQLGQSFKIYWELHAPNMIKKCGYYQLTCTQDEETEKYQINLEKMDN